MPVLQMTMLGEVKYIAQEGLTALMSPGAGTGTGVWGRYPHLPWSDVRNHPLRTLPLHRPGLLPKPTSEAYLVGLVAQAHELAFLVHLLHGHAPAGASVLGEAAPALGGLQLALFGDAAPTLGLGRVGGGPASAALCRPGSSALRGSDECWWGWKEVSENRHTLKQRSFIVC